jgi:L-methionine (R)-S-oxide reductase
MLTVSADEVKKEFEQLSSFAGSANELMERVVSLLRQRMPSYHWAGFYMLDTSVTPPMLQLGAFRGAATPHSRIPLNEGICGAAASTGETVIVDDVNNDPRYLACSIETKSEIVAPVFVRGKVVGELDIDSHFPAAFKEKDRELVEYCASLVGKLLETLPGQK